MNASQNRIITLITFYDPMKAQVVRTKLESEDIPCFVTDGNLFPTHSFYSNDGSIKIKVNASDLTKAQKILQQVHLDTPDKS